MLRRLGIGGKLRLAFGGLAALTVVVVVAGFLSGLIVTKDIGLAEAVHAPAALTSAQAQASLMRMQLHVRGYLVLGDPDDIEQYRAHQRAFEAHLGTLQALARTWSPGDALLVAQLTGEYEQWAPLPQKLFELHDNRPNTGEPYAYLRLYRTESAPKAQKLLRLLEELTQHQQTALQTDLGRARASIGWAGVPAVLGGTFAILLAVALASMAHRLIVGPVRRLTKISEQLAAGDLSARAEVEADDEIGRLAQLINTRLRKEDLQHLMASISDAVWAAEINAAGSFAYRYWSPVVERIAGVPPEHFVESPQRWLDTVHPEDRSALAAGRHRITSGETDREEAEYRIVRPDAAVRWVRDSVRATRLADGRIALNGVVSDITERKKAESALRESEARFRSLTELSSDWYWKQDENLRFTYLSAELFDKAGHTAESSIGKTRSELSDLTPVSSTWAEHQAVLDARQSFRDFEYYRLDGDGRPRYISVSGAPIFDENGRFKGYEGVGRDITERKAAQDELLRLERQLRQAQRLEAMGTLAGGIAHDFNNILGAILGYGEMALRDAPRGGRLRRDLDSILAAGERGRALVDRILAFSRSGVGERIAVHVQGVVRECLELIDAKLPEGITIETRLQAGRAAMLGDPTQVHQVLMNLATNAVQAMSVGGGTLRVLLTVASFDAPHVTTTGTIGAGEYIVLAVGDSGTGIAPEITERIFDPFFTTKEVGVGTGLGLSLVHGIVSEVGGAVDVASTPGQGSVFTVYLPRTGDVAGDHEREAGDLPRGDRQQILVVDDEEPLVRLTTESLAEWGYVPVAFTSSAAALEAFRAHPERYDAVITDERMPGMTGSALLREIRDIRPAIPTLLVSGYVGGDLMSRAREAGADEVLKKPLKMRDLATGLARVLQAHDAGAQA